MRLREISTNLKGISQKGIKDGIDSKEFVEVYKSPGEELNELGQRLNELQISSRQKSI